MSDRAFFLALGILIGSTIVGIAIKINSGTAASVNANSGTAQAEIDAEVAEAAKRDTLQELPPGKKLMGVTLTNRNDIVYLVRPMRTSETPEVYQLTEYETDPPAWVIREHAVDEKK